MSDFPQFTIHQKPDQDDYQLLNNSLADLLDVGIDPNSNLVGHRWLTRDGSMFVVAPSGHGKSSFCIQIAAYWSIGRTAFGFKPSRPLKILIVESEDDDADNKAFVQFIRTMNLSQEEMDLMNANTRLEFRRDLAGKRFFDAIDSFLTQFPADILIINPLTGFCTVDLKDEIGMNDFLRNKLNTVMAKHHCAPMIVAHMPKSQISAVADKEWYEWMYVLSGCVTLTNWARAILVFVPSKIRGTYKFITAKRPAQSGWIEPEYYFAHSKENVEINGGDFEIIQWIPATDQQIKAAIPSEQAKPKIHVTSQLIHQKMSPLAIFTRDSWRVWIKDSFAVGINAADSFLKAMTEDGRIKVHKGAGKGAAKETTFSKA